VSGTREVPLSGGAFALIDDDDMALVSQYKWHVNDGGYAVWRGIREGRRVTVRMHRLINTTPDGFVTDHINRDRLDNRKSNLRTVTQAENMRNIERGEGVWLHSQNNNWVVEVYRVHVGCFAEEGLARQIAEMIYNNELPLTRIKVYRSFCKHGHNKEEVGTYTGGGCKVCVLNNQKKYHERKKRNEYTKRG